ncbi:hypothetical protein BLA29_007641 [Euroglyphus maynei]|uniref:Uncharacterized protein n=1 Tax=Euroglyphus maynei TaxID=6958 RepID=A0A1Y3BRG4_EURMA|nr:hypothetical protein BLA29_007641 [Euroglyphus maynei]
MLDIIHSTRNHGYNSSCPTITTGTVQPTNESMGIGEEPGHMRLLFFQRTSITHGSCDINVYAEKIARSIHLLLENESNRFGTK